MRAADAWPSIRWSTLMSAPALVREIAGPDVAQAIQLAIEYDPQPPYDAGAPSKAPEAIRDLVTAVMRAAEADLVGDQS